MRVPVRPSDMGILAEASFGARLKAWSLELETVRYSVGTELEKNDAYVAIEKALCQHIGAVLKLEQ